MKGGFVIKAIRGIGGAIQAVGKADLSVGGSQPKDPRGGLGKGDSGKGQSGK